MKENSHDKNLDALHAGIARSREEIAVLAAELRRLADWKGDAQSGNGAAEQANGVEGWRAVQHGLGEAGVRGKRVLSGLAEEIERHPLLGGMAAFGLGFGIASLLFRRSKSGSR